MPTRDLASLYHLDLISVEVGTLTLGHVGSTSSRRHHDSKILCHLRHRDRVRSSADRRDRPARGSSLPNNDSQPAKAGESLGSAVGTSTPPEPNNCTCQLLCPVCVCLRPSVSCLFHLQWLAVQEWHQPAFLNGAFTSIGRLLNSSGFIVRFFLHFAPPSLSPSIN